MNKFFLHCRDETLKPPRTFTLPGHLQAKSRCIDPELTGWNVLETVLVVGAVLAALRNKLPCRLHLAV